MVKKLWRIVNFEIRIEFVSNVDITVGYLFLSS